MFERLSTEPIYNTRAVVQRTGVPADTFRAWERRYGVPVPTRTAGNQRLYSERDIATINWLRDQTNSKVTISQAIALLRSQSQSRNGTASTDSRGIAAEPVPDAADASDPFAGVRLELVESLIALDGNRADRIVEEALGLAGVESVCLHILQGALTEIGDRWEHGTVNVASEHFASSYVHRKFGALFNHSTPDEGRGPIVAACPEGELHEIGLLLSSLFLSRRGYRVLFLGANLPLADLTAMVERVQPPLVMLSASGEESARQIAESIAPLKAVVREGVARDLPRIGYGGTIFNSRPELMEGIDGIFLGRDAHEVIVSVDRIFSLIPV